MTSHSRSFGDLIKSKRLRLGFNTKDFTQRCGDIFSLAYLTKIELYDEIPSPKVVIILANVLDYPVEYLLERARKAKIQNYIKLISKKYKI